MSDELDCIVNAEAIHLRAALSHISAVIPEGVRGECDNCGAEMPRLIGGLCGFCRDGRRPPADQYPVLAPPVLVQPRLDEPVVVQAATAPAPGVAIPAEEDTMPELPNRKITIEGLALGAVESRANDNDISFKQAAAELIEMGAAQGGATNSISAELVAADVSDLSDDELLSELRNRLDGDATAISAAVARAQRAEEQLAMIRQTVLGTGAPA